MSDTLQQQIKDFFSLVCERSGHEIHHGITEGDGTIRLGTSQHARGGDEVYVDICLRPLGNGGYAVGSFLTVVNDSSHNPKPPDKTGVDVLGFRGKSSFRANDFFTTPLKTMWMVRTQENFARLLKDYASLAGLKGRAPVFDAMLKFDLG